jgi:hypothetical protein
MHQTTPGFKHKPSHLFRKQGAGRQVGKGSWKRRGDDEAYRETMEPICANHEPRRGKTSYVYKNDGTVEEKAL